MSDNKEINKTQASSVEEKNTESTVEVPSETHNATEVHNLERKAQDIDYIALLTPIAIFLGAVIIAVVLFVSSLSLTSQMKTSAENLITAIKTIKLETTGTTPSTPQEETKAAITEDQIKTILADNSNITLGNKNAKVHFIEFSDPSCPYCHIAAGLNDEFTKMDQFKTVANGGSYQPAVPEMKKLVQEGRASFTFFYSNGHGAGELASQALYCAQEKGKFWEVHDLFMTKSGYDKINNELKNDVANSDKLAEFISPAIDQSFMSECLKSKKYANRISSDQALGTSLGVRGTPGFFINTTSFAGAYGYDAMKPIVDELLK